MNTQRRRAVRVALVAALATAGLALTHAPAEAVSDTINGYVMSAASGNTVPNAIVQAYTYDVDREGYALAQTVTADGDGHYVLTAAGMCDALLFAFDPTGANGHIGGTPECTGGLDTLDFTLGAGGRIDSAITDAITGDPVEGVCVDVTFAMSPGDYRIALRMPDCSDSNGHLVTPGLDPQYYTVTFIPPTGSPYQREDFDGVHDWSAEPDLVPVHAGVTTHVDPTLDHGAVLTGVVLADDTGMPVAGVEVWAGTGDTDVTDAFGNFTIGGAPDGEGVLYAKPSDGVHTWGSQGFEVVGGADLTGLEIVVPVGGSISGIVTDTAANPIDGACIYLDVNSPPVMCTNADGLYTLGGLDGYPQDVTVEAPGYLADTTTVDVNPPDDTTHDVELLHASSISGNVALAEGGAAIGGGTVIAIDETSGFSASAIAAPDGGYTIEGLPAGTYLVHEVGGEISSYAPEYYNGAQTAGAATPVVVAAEAEVTGIDFALDLGGMITGTVTRSGGSPLVGVVVTTELNGVRRMGISGVDGVYVLRGLSTDEYPVTFTGPDTASPTYQTEMFDDTSPYGDPTLVGVAIGVTTTNVDAEMTQLARISGSVVSSGAGLPVGGYVDVLDPVSGSMQTGTMHAGTYSLDVPPGDYVVRAQGLHRFQQEYYDGVEAFADSTPITVIEGQVLDVDFTMADPLDTFLPLAAPVRLYDSRAGQLGAIEQPGGSLGADATLPLSANVARRIVVTDVAGVPSDPVGMALSVVAVQPTGNGNIAVYPCATAADAAPDTSTVNFAAGLTVANSAIIDPDPSGGLCLKSSRNTHVLLDVTGTFQVGLIPTLTPVRLLDTRSGQLGSLEQPDGWVGSDLTAMLAPNVPLMVQVVGIDGIPDGATGLAVNVTALGATGNGFVTVYGCPEWDITPPPTSTLNLVPGRAVANSAIVKGDGKSLCIVASRAVHVIVDMTGYFEFGYQAEWQPERLLDTRAGQLGTMEEPDGWLGADRTTRLVAGNVERFEIPSSPFVGTTTAVSLNVTAVRPGGVANGNLKLYPCTSTSSPQPQASALNYVPGVTVANGVILALGTSTGVCVVSSQPIDLIIDYSGRLW